MFEKFVCLKEPVKGERKLLVATFEEVKITYKVEVALGGGKMKILDERQWKHCVSDVNSDIY